MLAAVDPDNPADEAGDVEVGDAHQYPHRSPGGRHDRRGNDIYERDPDGAEKVYTETRSVLRRRRGRLEPVQTTVQEKRVDDDLPRIAEAYQAYRTNGEIKI